MEKYIKFYDVDDVCRMLKIGKHTALRLFNEDDFPSIRIGRKFWVQEESLKNYLSKKVDWKEGVKYGTRKKQKNRV